MRLGITMDTKSIHVGVLPDGRKAIARPYSRYGCPVLEIRGVDHKEKVIKIKYQNKNEANDNLKSD